MATPLQKIPLLYPETLEVPIRGRVQLRILELGDEAGEKQKKKKRGRLYFQTIPVTVFSFCVGWTLFTKTNYAFLINFPPLLSGKNFSNFSFQHGFPPGGRLTICSRDGSNLKKGLAYIQGL